MNALRLKKRLINQPDQPEAAFICPGHPLLDTVLTLTLEQHRDLLKQGAILVDPNDTGNQVSVLFFVEHAIQDGTETATGEARVIVSKRTLYIKVDEAGTMRDSAYAPIS